MLARVSMLRRLFCPTKTFVSFLIKTAFSRFDPNEIRAVCWFCSCRCLLRLAEIRAEADRVREENPQTQQHT